MPKFIPPNIGEEVKSNAEKKIFNILHDELKLDDAYIFHSLGLPRHNKKIYGEIDFVIVCKRGVACFEIKGGRVDCVDGEWHFTDRYGNVHIKNESPFAQVKGNAFSLREEISNVFPNNMRIVNTLFARGVMFTDIEFKAKGVEIIPEIVYDLRTEDITAYINGVFDYWESRLPGRNLSRLSPRDIEDISKYLRGNFAFVPMLSSRINDIEKNIVRLTRDQADLMDSLSGNDRLIVRGGAGTGKTLLAVHYAIMQARENKKVLYVTYNKNLARNVANKLDEDVKENIKVINIHALFGEYVTVDTVKMAKDSNKYFREDFPESFCDYMSGLEDDELKKMQYDVLIMDEGQDILMDTYMYGIDYLFKGGFDKGRWAVFYDENQNLFNPSFDEGIKLLKPDRNTKFNLNTNCRNTIQIGTYNAYTSGMEFMPHLKEDGEEVQVIEYSDEKDFAKKTEDIIKKLRSEGIKLDNVVFLSPKKYKNSKMSKGCKVKVNELNDSFEPIKDKPIYATIQGFKGLDAQIIIFVDTDKIRYENRAQYVYTACSRARTLLYVLVDKEHSEGWHINK